MLTILSTLRAASGIAALALALPVAAQDDAVAQLPELPPVGKPVVMPMSDAEIRTLPVEYQSLSVAAPSTSTTIGDDGVETITRTRYITSTAPARTTIHHGVQAAAPVPAPVPVSAPAHPIHYQTTYVQAAYPAATFAPMVLDREQWIAECERRTDGRSDDDKGGIIGALLGAIGGGIAGHELAAAGDALGGTLLGAGLGGLAGLAIGSLIDADDDEERYNCTAALDTYLDQYAKHGAHYAARTIPVQPAPVHAYHYGYAQAPAAYYPAQPTMVMVPVTTYQQQRVIVRETVREEFVEGAARNVPPAPVPVPLPQPSPKMIKQAPAPSAKMIKY